MLDTVKLMVDHGCYKITKPDNFNPSANLFGLKPYQKVSRSGDLHCAYYPSDKNYRNGTNDQYLPKVSLHRMRVGENYTTFLKLEFSAPKILFGNNFQELVDSDFPDLIKALHRKLQFMGVEIDPLFLEKAKVMTVHFAKNLVITEYGSCLYLLNAIYKADVTKTLDVAKTDYRNNGSIVRFHSNTSELCFYDKMKDLETSQKVSETRSFEDSSFLQKEMLEKYKNHEILRMEFRLNAPQKLTAICNKVENGTMQYYFFHEIFSQSLSRKVCIHYWEIIRKGMKHLVLQDSSLDKIMEFLMDGRKWETGKFLSTLGALYLANDKGIRFLREKSLKKYNEIKNIFKHTSQFNNGYLMKTGAKIANALHEFTPLRDGEFEPYKYRSPFDMPIDVNTMKIPGLFL